MSVIEAIPQTDGLDIRGNRAESLRKLPHGRRLVVLSGDVVESPAAGVALPAGSNGGEQSIQPLLIMYEKRLIEFALPGQARHG